MAKAVLSNHARSATTATRKEVAKKRWATKWVTTQGSGAQTGARYVLVRVEESSECTSRNGESVANDEQLATRRMRPAQGDRKKKKECGVPNKRKPVDGEGRSEEAANGINEGKVRKVVVEGGTRHAKRTREFKTAWCFSLFFPLVLVAWLATAVDPAWRV